MTRVFAALGAFLFAASLTFFGWWYLWPIGPAESPGTAWNQDAAWSPILWDVTIFTVFALHHSILARSGVKRAVGDLVSPALERSVFVYVASVLFFGVCLGWRAVPGVLWSAPPWWPLLSGVQIAGIVLSVTAARRLRLLELAGVNQASGKTRAGTGLVVTNGLYRLVRHPIYFGWLLIVWPTPDLTATRLVFAATSSLYLVIAIWFEERDLVRNAGEPYAQYCRQVRWKLIPYIY